MIRSVADCIRYFEGVRRRTWVAVDRVTPALVGWRPRPDEWSCGAIVRHLAGAERFFVARVVDDRWTEDLDPGPERELAATRALLSDGHAREMARLATVPDTRLEESIRDLEGPTMRLWRWVSCERVLCSVTINGATPPASLAAQIAIRLAWPMDETRTRGRSRRR